MAGLVPGTIPAGPSEYGQSVPETRDPSEIPLLEKLLPPPATGGLERMDTTWVYCTTFTTVLGIASLGYGLGYTSPIQAELTDALDLSISEFSFFGSLVTLGAMAGSVLSGRTADYLGRKGALFTISILATGGYVLMALAKGLLSLYVGRFLTGFAGGLSCYVVPVFIAEIAPVRLRGSLGTMQQVALTMGICTPYLIGMFLKWRILAVAGTIPSLLCLVWLIFIPESPRWLAKVGKDRDMERSLKKLRGNNYDISEEMKEIQAYVDSSKDEPQAKLSDIFTKKYSRPLTVGFTLHALQQITGINGVMLYSASIFQMAGIENAKIAALGLGLLQVIMTLVAALLVDRAGRRLLLLVSFTGMTLGHFGVGFAFYLREFEGVTSSPGISLFVNILSLVGILLFVALFSVGEGPVPWIMIGEIFPSQVKGIAGSTASLVNWSNAWIVTLTFNFLFAWSAPGTFWIYCGFSLFGLIFVAVGVPETRGKTLEEIEQSFK